ncbi:hypothetical protein FRC09_009608, partial [Ceratobasidium sp. 395]
IQDSDIAHLEESVLQSPRANAIRQLVLISLAELSYRPALSEVQCTRIVNVLNGYVKSTRMISNNVPPALLACLVKTVVGIVSEKRSVEIIGFLRRSATPSGGAAAIMPAQTTNNLLADLFGGGSAQVAASSSPASAPLENLIHDILGLFDITLAASSPTATSTPALT